MRSSIDTYILNNGVRIPCIGFGTWQASNGSVAEQAVIAAIKAGYRHIDCASAYENQVSVGEGITKSGVKREDIFITSKLFNPDHGYKKTIDAFEKTMKELRLDYLDLYLIHWPNPIAYRNSWEEANAETWRAFEEFYKAGRIRALGVSNFHAHHLEALAKTASVQPAVNQIRVCPGDTKDDVVKYNAVKGLLTEAYSPLGGSGPGSLLNDGILKIVAEKYSKTTAQVCIRWSLQKGFLPLPKSVNPERIAANVNVFDFELNSEEMEKIGNLEGYPDIHPHPDQITW
jgi:diketogulonate reductase-like aldo/keto reductase